MSVYLTVPQIIRPKYEVPQPQALEWLAKAHAEASDEIDFERFKKLIHRYGCSPDKIGNRGTCLEDTLHTDFKNMKIFNLSKHTSGSLMSERMKIYQSEVDQIFSKIYDKSESAPDHIFHVSCTGYYSPSGAQKVVAQKKWPTIVTHAYHMGCYAAIPTIRLALNHILANDQINADIVHTELCTLHMNPSLHDPEQLVVQSLFADGFCHYTLTAKKPEKGYRIINIKESIIPETENSMTWGLADFGMQMTLHRDVPALIKGQLREFVRQLTGTHNIQDFNYAIHPGGPKIIEGVVEVLGLADDKAMVSKSVLHSYGNMSSATLPHVWNHFSKHEESKNPIISLAFGPGLTMCGLLLEPI